MPASPGTGDLASIRVFEFIEHQAVARDWSDFLAHRRESGRLYRVDIAEPDARTLSGYLATLHPDPLVVERCLDTEAFSGVYTYDGMVALQLPLTLDWRDSLHPKLSILCFPNALVTIRNVEPRPDDELALIDLKMKASGQSAIESRLFALLDAIVDRSSELTLQARRSVDQLETDMEQPLDEEWISRRILALKRAAAHFEIALEARHRTLMALLSLDSPLLDLQRIREPLRDVVAHIEHSLRYLERIEDHLDELDRHFLLLLQDRTNNRLRVLTIISAIFMPLMLITGIYGMNFRHMPELYWEYGYWVVLTVMLFIAAGLLWYFWRRGWFR
ncbi:MAG TPA: hypothetical protein ENK05_01495 [Gammaproteobacteria bacterium]|nr:hypothetical protein [Gammaproteobacteria bacterium]